MVKRRLSTRLRWLFCYSDLDIIRMWLGVAALIWSFLLLWPGSVFDRPVYSVMRDFASETTWGLLFGLQGTVMLWSLLVGYRNKVTLTIDGVLGCVLWTVATTSMLLSVYPPPTLAAEVMASLASWWVLVRYQLPQRKKHQLEGQ